MIEITKIIDGLTLLLGGGCMALSAYTGYKFFRTKTLLGHYIGVNKFGEALAAFTPFVFTMAAFFGWRNEMPVWIVELLRISLFVSLGVTTWLLLRVVRQISRGDEDDAG